MCRAETAGTAGVRDEEALRAFGISRSPARAQTCAPSDRRSAPHRIHGHAAGHGSGNDGRRDRVVSFARLRGNPAVLQESHTWRPFYGAGSSERGLKPATTFGEPGSSLWEPGSSLWEPYSSLWEPCTSLWEPGSSPM